MLESSDFLKAQGLQTVFVSVSPVLVNEVSRFYHRLKDAVVAHLQKKEAARAAEREEGFTELSAESVTTVADEHDKLMELAKFESELIEEELADQQQQTLPNAFDKLEFKNFPLFVTVKQLLYMLDASLNNSYFARD